MFVTLSHTSHFSVLKPTLYSYVQQVSTVFIYSSFFFFKTYKTALNLLGQWHRFRKQIYKRPARIHGNQASLVYRRLFLSCLSSPPLCLRFLGDLCNDEGDLWDEEGDLCDEDLCDDLWGDLWEDLCLSLCLCLLLLWRSGSSSPYLSRSMSAINKQNQVFVTITLKFRDRKLKCP